MIAVGAVFEEFGNAQSHIHKALYRSGHPASAEYSKAEQKDKGCNENIKSYYPGMPRGKPEEFSCIPELIDLSHECDEYRKYQHKKEVQQSIMLRIIFTSYIHLSDISNIFFDI